VQSGSKLFGLWGVTEPPSTDRQAQELYEWLGQEAKNIPLGDMTKARNDCKLGVLTDLPASSTGVAILATEAIVMVAQSTEGTTALS
jgi:hypothetical protein